MTKMKLILYISFMFALSASWVGQDLVLAEQSSCVMDSTGESVCLKKVPDRLVSLAPSLTELVFDLNAGSKLVGRTTRCNHPEKAKKVLDIGPYMTPDFEKLLTVKPDLVLAPKNGMRSELISRIKNFGIPVYVDDSGSVEDINRLIRNIGVLLSESAEAEQITSQIELRRQKIRRIVSGLERPSVLFVVGINPLIVGSSTSFLSSLVSEAGGRNVVSDLSIPYPKFSIEEVIRQDPDVIFMLDKECHGIECLDYWKNYGFLKAVKNKRVYEVDSDLMSRPGCRTIEALEALVHHLHPHHTTEVELSTMVHAHSESD